MRPAPTLTLLAAALAIGCAGKAPARAPAPSATEPAVPTRQPTPTATTIEQLDAEIRQWRTELGLAPQPLTTVDVDVAGVCGDLTECQDPCTLADKICENADKICAIASDLNDPRATQTCERARKSCSDARAICECCEKQRGDL